MGLTYGLIYSFKNDQIQRLHRHLKDSEETVERLRLTISKYEAGRTERQARDVETGTRKDVVIKKLRKELVKKDALIGRDQEILKRYEACFTPGQNKFIRTGKRPHKWSDEDISWAMSLYMASPKAYKLMRKKYRLPGVPTLKERCRRVILEPGIVRPILPLFEKMDKRERVCCLYFDEMKVEEVIEWDPRLKKVMLPCKYVQVMIARGYFSDWKQVVYFDFDQPMTDQLFLFIVSQLEDAGLIPISATSDLGSTNRKMRNDLSITEDNPVLLSPGGNRIIFFADPPHMLKLLRGHYIRCGFTYPGTTLNADAIHVLHNIQKHSDLKYAPNLREEHLNVEGPRAQKVSLAAQLLSNKVSAGIKQLWSNPIIKRSMPENSLDNAEFIDVVNQWFDLNNMGVPIIDSRPSKQAYGRCLKEQDEILNRMDDYMKKIRSRKTGYRIPFQSAIISNVNGLRILHALLVEEYDEHNVLTRFLNQDPIERFFGTMRYKGGGLYDHPTPMTFVQRLRACILGKLITNLINK